MMLRADNNTPDTVFSELEKLERNTVADGWSAESFRSEAKKENGWVLYIQENGKPAALLTGYYAAGEGDITNVAVSPEYRRRGFACELIAEFIRQLPADAQEIFLEVRESNIPAIELYRKCGFEQVGMRKGFYVNPRENALVMRKVRTS